MGSSLSTANTEWQIDNLPNRITMFRVILIPVICTPLFINVLKLESFSQYTHFFNYFSAWTFVFAGITDFLDGYFARKRNIVTVFGSFLDPIADKFLVVSCLLLLQELGRIPVLIVIILVLREIYITALRLLAVERGLIIPVGKLGKWKTTFQMFAIAWLMTDDRPWGLIPFPEMGTVAIYLASGISLYSALEYSKGLISKIKASHLAKKGNK